MIWDLGFLRSHSNSSAIGSKSEAKVDGSSLLAENMALWEQMWGTWRSAIGGSKGRMCLQIEIETQGISLHRSRSGGQTGDVDEKEELATTIDRDEVSGGGGG